MAVANVNNNNITGARCVFVLGGQVVAYCRSVSWSFQYEYSELRVLNNLAVEDHVPVSYRASLSFSQFRIPKQTLGSMGFFPKTGATPNEQLESVLTIPPLTAVVVDGISGSAIATFVGVKIAGGSFSLDAGGNVLGNEVDAVVRKIYSEEETAPSN